MATNLKPVDVVVVGLGAAGGVAVLPLTRAGIKVDGARSRQLDAAQRFQGRRNS